jgi:hypothetical protein
MGGKIGAWSSIWYKTTWSSGESHGREGTLDNLAQWEIFFRLVWHNGAFATPKGLLWLNQWIMACLSSLALSLCVYLSLWLSFSGDCRWWTFHSTSNCIPKGKDLKMDRVHWFEHFPSFFFFSFQTTTTTATITLCRPTALCMYLAR